VERLIGMAAVHLRFPSFGGTIFRLEMLRRNPQTGRKTMKTQFTVALSMLAGAALGAVAVHSLHAQAKPPVYYISEIDVTNPDAYAKEYAPKAQAIIKAAGGRFLAIGGTAATGAKYFDCV
jgi:hypothetical protein